MLWWAAISLPAPFPWAAGGAGQRAMCMSPELWGPWLLSSLPWCGLPSNALHAAFLHCSPAQPLLARSQGMWREVLTLEGASYIAEALWYQKQGSVLGAW